MRLILAGALLLAGCGITGQPQRSASLKHGGAQQLPCGPRQEVLELLAAASAQRPVAHALAGAGGLIAHASIFEILAEPDGSTWTAILTAPNGVSCLLAGGEGWQHFGDLRAAWPGPARGTEAPSPGSHGRTATVEEATP